MRMVYIAVCDDDRKLREDIGNIVNRSCDRAGVLWKTEYFEGSVQLRDELQGGAYFDILLLDIEMPEMDGITFALDVKAYLTDVMVIFVSFHDKYIFKCFSVHPYYFVRKMELETELPKVMDAALQVAGRREDKCLVVENQRVLEKILFKDIIYIWHRGKYVNIESADGKCIKARKTLKQIFNELPAEEFEWADRGYIVGLRHILRFNGRMVILTNDIGLDISKDRLAELRKRVKDFWIEGR